MVLRQRYHLSTNNPVGSDNQNSSASVSVPAFRNHQNRIQRSLVHEHSSNSIRQDLNSQNTRLNRITPSLLETEPTTDSLPSSTNQTNSLQIEEERIRLGEAQGDSVPTEYSNLPENSGGGNGNGGGRRNSGIGFSSPDDRPHEFRPNFNIEPRNRTEEPHQLIGDASSSQEVGTVQNPRNNNSIDDLLTIESEDHLTIIHRQFLREEAEGDGQLLNPDTLGNQGPGSLQRPERSDVSTTFSSENPGPFSVLPSPSGNVSFPPPSFDLRNSLEDSDAPTENPNVTAASTFGVAPTGSDRNFIPPVVHAPRFPQSYPIVEPLSIEPPSVEVEENGDPPQEIPGISLILGKIIHYGGSLTKVDFGYRVKFSGLDRSSKWKLKGKVVALFGVSTDIGASPHEPDLVQGRGSFGIVKVDSGDLHLEYEAGRIGQSNLTGVKYNKISGGLPLKKIIRQLTEDIRLHGGYYTEKKWLPLPQNIKKNFFFKVFKDYQKEFMLPGNFLGLGLNINGGIVIVPFSRSKTTNRVHFSSATSPIRDLTFKKQLDALRKEQQVTANKLFEKIGEIGISQEQLSISQEQLGISQEQMSEEMREGFQKQNEPLQKDHQQQEASGMLINTLNKVIASQKQMIWQISEIFQQKERVLVEKINQIGVSQKCVGDDIQKSIKMQESTNETLSANFEKIGMDSKARDELLIKEVFLNHNKLVDNQRNLQDNQEILHKDLLRGIQNQNSCCVEIKSSLSSLKEQIDQKDFPFQNLFRLGWVTVSQMLFHEFLGGLILSVPLTLVFAFFYLTGNYYLKIYSIYDKKEKGINFYKNKFLLFFAYISCFSFSFTIPCALIICWTYTTFIPQKITIFEIFTTIAEDKFPSDTVPLLGKNKLFLLFQVAQFLAFPLRAVLALGGLLIARKRSLLIFNNPLMFAKLLGSTILFSYSRLYIDSFLNKQIKQKEERNITGLEDSKKEKKIFSFNSPPIKDTLILSISLCTGAQALLCITKAAIEAGRVVYPRIFKSEIKNEKKVEIETNTEKE